MHKFEQTFRVSSYVQHIALITLLCPAKREQATSRSGNLKGSANLPFPHLNKYSIAL